MSAISEHLLNDIAVEVYHVVPEGPRAFFLYVKGGNGFIGVSLYHNRGNEVRYIDDLGSLEDLFTDLWNNSEEGHKWHVVQMTVDGSKFTVEYDYTERTDDDHHDYRQDALIARFGDKPIIYPDWDPEAVLRRALAKGGGAFEL